MNQHCKNAKSYTPIREAMSEGYVIKMNKLQQKKVPTYITAHPNTEAYLPPIISNNNPDTMNNMVTASVNTFIKFAMINHCALQHLLVSTMSPPS